MSATRATSTPPVHEFVVKSAKIKGRLTTNTGRRMGQERHDWMIAFFARREAEVKGEARISIAGGLVTGRLSAASVLFPRSPNVGCKDQ